MIRPAEQQHCWVAAVIRDDDANVLVARWADTQAWDLPAGVLRRGEDVCTGVRRVVADTVTIGVTVGWLAGIHAHIRDGITMVFLAQHVTGRAAACGDVQLCRWVPADTAVRMLWPRRADQLRGALLAQHPQPVMVEHPRPRRQDLSSNQFARIAGASGLVPRRHSD